MSLELAAGVEPVPGYVLVRRLGRGGFGEVWEATAPGGVRVALKFIRLDTAEAGPEQRALEVIRDIRHPHLLDVQFAVRAQDCLVIGMPLCDESLWDRLRACRDRSLPGLPRDELLCYMNELARAIDFLNELRHPAGDGTLVGVQHRDIKPQNIFLVGGSARLADFGLAKVIQTTVADCSLWLSPNYVAPEVLEGRVARWTDQYSLAVTYYHLRTGRLPFNAESINQMIKAHLLDPPDLTALAPEERPVLARALAKRPEERWPTCRAFVLGLESAALAEDARLAAEKGATTRLKPRDVQPHVEADVATDTLLLDQKSPEEASRGNTGPKRSAASRPSSTWRNLVVMGGGLLVLLAVATYIARNYIARNKVRPPKRNERLVSEPPPVSPKAGAPFPVPDAPRPFVGDRDILAAIRNNLVNTPLTDRPFQRYFTLANLHNNRKVLDHDLRLARAAMAKLFNSLSWKPKIVVPRSIDPHETVYVVDLRDLGALWKERNLWAEILRFEKADDMARFVGARDETHRGYPYGLDYEKASDEEVQRLAGEVGGLTGCELCFVRADWFIATASRPPLYETILDLPADSRVLERRLGVDVEGDFLRDRLARAGFVTSRVSSHNRMVERHEAAFGAYWKSYDFKTDDGTANLLQFPLGPVFDGNPFERHAFEHAGSEIIFNLPNGLQGYLLVNNKDERIEAGPIEVVAGALRTLGTATVVDGLSCISCHRNGMIGGFEDKVREGNAVAGEARGKVERLYPRKGEMDRLLSQDEDRFLAALTKATGSILQTGDDKAKPIRDFPEPIDVVARLYLKDLGLDEIAAELGIAEPKDLQSLILANPALQRLGLGLLLQPGGRLKRAAWESLQSVNSPFQEAAKQLERGTPLHEL